ncbi:MAG TPA: efflux RND transporter periplasmic adaptor subunit, partial [Sphingomicrobium sp.]|nr:efflux RND transporter periplasmic adaptor subunit [Sphingomicrobium sp.]
TVVLQPIGIPAGLAQGQAVRARIMPRTNAPQVIVLPEEAVQQVGGRDMVFVQVAGGFQAVAVTVGQRSGGRIEILEGLRPGLNVVTQGAFVLKSQLGASEAEH